MRFRPLAALRWSVIALLVAVLAIPALAVAITKHTVVEVDGESMLPTYAVGDVVTIRPAAAKDLVPGTVVTVATDAGERYTHRIVDVAEDGFLVLKGDNNDVEDPAPVDPGAVVGVVDGHLTGMGATTALELQGWPLRICLLVIVLGLIFFPLIAPSKGSARRAAPTLLPSPGPQRRSTVPRSGSARTARSDGSAAGRDEVLGLVESVRGAAASALLASDRRLAAGFTATTLSSRGEFPALRVVIDISEKEASRFAAAATVPPAGIPEATPPARRSARSDWDPGAWEARARTRAAAAGSSSVVSTADLPTRRSQRGNTGHGRRRAGR